MCCKHSEALSLNHIGFILLKAFLNPPTAGSKPVLWAWFVTQGGYFSGRLLLSLKVLSHE